MPTENKANLIDITNPDHECTWPAAIFDGLSTTGGLYMPRQLNPLPHSFFQQLKDLTLPDLATEIIFHIAPQLLPHSQLRSILNEALNFAAPLHVLTDNISCLELFHGPSLAFKDFGARCMAGIMTALRATQDLPNEQPLTILSATSGDTGGAVAQAFYNQPGFRVVILYPAGKVSRIQESQFTTLGGNVQTLKVAGNFDDCQRLVKQAFLDAPLRKICPISSANSINLARLLPQTCYYFEAYKQMARDGETLHVAVPSGNFGNIVAALISKQLGLPLGRLIAGVNANRVFVNYLESGHFQPQPSIATISNAMDVGSPNNFPRLLHLCGNSIEQVHQHFSGFSYSDQQTQQIITEVFTNYNYICDPHSAIGYQALVDYLRQNSGRGFFLHTAHPAKFKEAVEPLVGSALKIPERLEKALEKPSLAHPISSDYQEFRSFLLNLL